VARGAEANLGVQVSMGIPVHASLAAKKRRSRHAATQQAPDFLGNIILWAMAIAGGDDPFYTGVHQGGNRRSHSQQPLSAPAHTIRNFLPGFVMDGPFRLSKQLRNTAVHKLLRRKDPSSNKLASDSFFSV
jgi:hypothetical protein